MASIDLSNSVVGVIGAGAMGVGIAEVAARAGHHVLLYDINVDACRDGLSALHQRLEKRVSRGKLERDHAASIRSNIQIVADLSAFAPCRLVVEAVIERLDIKQELFIGLEKIVDEECVLASNTSSISITAIASVLTKPERFAGLHFFNPAPVMKLVEVIAGLQTQDTIVQSLLALGKQWDKVPVRVKSVPGFIVNRVARPFYAEGFLALEQGAGTPSQIDAVLTECAGFRMGPLSLTDLIGHDVNAAVGQSVFEAYDGGVRFRPSLMQKELVAAGRLGRKTSHGVYTYNNDQSKDVVYDNAPSDALDDTLDNALLSFPADPVPIVKWFQEKAGARHVPQAMNDTLPKDAFLINDALICLGDGKSALAQSLEVGRPVIMLDWVHDLDKARVVAFAISPNVEPQTLCAFQDFLSIIGVNAILLGDRPGLIALRTIVMLINSACDAAGDQVATEEDIDHAMQYGVNYPRGLFHWGRLLGFQFVHRALANIFAETNDPIYAPSHYLGRLAMKEALKEGAVS